MSEQRPNIVFITTDTQSREMLSTFVDRPGVETPNLDRLAAQSVVFENTYVVSPLCTPSRSGWYTGCYPNRNGAWANDMSVARHVPLLAELLTEQGYDAYHVGKWHLDSGGYDGRGQADGGFAEGEWYDLSNFYDEVGREGINRFGGWNKGLEDITYCYGHRVVDRAVDILQEAAHRDKPFFLAVELDEPHGPYICPPPFRGRFAQETIYNPPTFMADMENKPRLQQQYAAWLAASRQTPQTFPSYYHRYYDCNSYADFEIGRVLAAIEQVCPQNTVVIFTSDHGDHLGAFGLCAKGPTMYDKTTRVPLLIRFPEGSVPPRRVSCLVNSLDIWATLLHIAGLNVAENGRFSTKDGYDARSLLPIIYGQKTAVRDFLVMEYQRFGAKFHQCGGLYPIRCLVTDAWKLSINLLDSDELYDRHHDPEEATNLIGRSDLQHIRLKLHDQLIAFQDDTQDVFRGEQWKRRYWRPESPAVFEGLATTGYKDEWPFAFAG